MDVDKIFYTIRHRRAIRKIEKKYKGYNTIPILLHDLDKIFLYVFFSKKIVSKIHRLYSPHHINNKCGIVNIDEAIFDWESARYTKPDKPLNAYDTCKKYYPDLLDVVSKRLKKLGIKKEIKI